MIKLSGKEYLQVADRIVWFRSDYPEGTIETTIVSIDEDKGSAIFRARITTGQGGIAEATGSETLKDFPQGWIEKAESKAVGRALGYLGYGTAAAGFEEGQRVVDAPRDIRPQPAYAPLRNGSAPTRVSAPPQPQSAPQTPAPALAPDDPLADVLATLRGMETRREPWAAIKKYGDEQSALADDYGRQTITSTLHGIAARRKSAAPAAPSFAGAAG